MPQSIAIAVFVFGAVLLLIALVGGRFKLFGAEIAGTVGRAGRCVGGVAGTALLAIGLFAAFQPPPTPSLTPTPARPTPAPRSAPASVPDARAYDPYRSFHAAAVSREPRDPLKDPRVQAAIRLVLGGEDASQARKLMAEAGWPNGFAVTLRLDRFREAGGSERDADLVSGKLRTLGVSVEKTR